jgi:hypothetical protein
MLPPTARGIAVYFLPLGRSNLAQGQPAAERPSANFASMLDAEVPPPALPGLLNGTQPVCGREPNIGRFEARVETGLFGTISES